MQGLARYTTEEQGADIFSLFIFTEEGGEYPMDLFKLCGTIALNGVKEAKKDIGDVGKTASNTGKETTSAFGKIGNAVLSAFKNEKVEAFGQSLERVTNKVSGQQNRLDLLKTKYKDLYLQFGENSKEAQECAKEIEKLSNELKENKEKLGEAEKAADKFDNSLEEVEEELEDVTDKSKMAGKEMPAIFKKIGAAVAAAFAVEKIVAFGQACIDATVAISAETASFEQIMGDYSDKAQAKIKEVADATGIVEGRLTGYMTSMTAKFQGLGYEIDDATDLAQSGLTIAADAAAFWDKSMEDAMSSLNSFVNGNYEGGEAIGLFANETTLASWAAENLNLDWKNLSEAEKQFTRLEFAKAMQENSGVTGQAANEADAYANVTGNLKRTWEEFLAVVGTPVLEKLIPILKKTTDVIGNLKTHMDSVSFDKLSNMIPESTQKILSDFATNIGNMASKMKDSAFQTFGDSFNKIKDVIQATSPFLEQLGNNYLTTLFNRFEQMGSYISGVVVPVFNFLVTALTDVGTVIWEAVAPYVTEISNKFTELSDIVTDAIDTYIVPTIQTFVDMVQELWNENQDKIQKIGTLFEKVFSLIAKIISSGVDNFKKYILPFITWFVDIVQSNMGNIQSIFQATFDYIGAIVDFFIALFEGDWEGMWEAIKSMATAAVANMKACFTTISSFLSSIGQKIGSIAKDAFQKVFDFMTTPIRTAVALATTLFNTLVTNIKDKIDTAKTTVKNGLDAIKDFFDKLKLKLPDIKLPHFKLNGEFDLSKGKVPSIGVEWYAKGAVLNQPTAFGINPATGKVMAGGEAGAEAVAPIDVLQNYVRQAVAEANANDGTHQMIELLQQQNELLMAMLQKDTSLKIDGREFGRMVNKYA